MRIIKNIFRRRDSRRSDKYETADTQIQKDRDFLKQIQITSNLVTLSNPIRQVFPLRSDHQSTIENSLAKGLDDGVTIFAYSTRHQGSEFFQLEWVFTKLEQEAKQNNFVVVEIAPALRYVDTCLLSKEPSKPIPEECQGRCAFILFAEDGYLVFDFSGKYLGRTKTFDPKYEFP